MVSGGWRTHWLLRDPGMPAGDTARNGLTYRANLPFGARRAAELGAIAAREMGRRLEAARRRDVDYGHGGLQQQLTGAPQPHLQVVAVRDTIQVAFEQPLDLPPRQGRAGRDLIE